jgi:hypothetical protein
MAGSKQGEKMNKNLKAGLIVGGVAVGLLVLAFAANAAGLTMNYANMPFRQQMMQGAGGWQGSMMGGGSAGGMMGNMMYMMGGQAGHMMDFDDMPHRNWTSADGQAPWENCPYFNQAQ